MKKAIAFFVLIILGQSICFAQAESLSNFDGNMWLQWDKITKKSFLAGFMLGASTCGENNMSYIPFDNLHETEGILLSGAICGDKKQNSFNLREICGLLNSNNKKIKRYNIYGLSDLQLSDGLDSLYADFKNMQIKLADAVYVVRDQCEGYSVEEIEAILQFLRGGKEEIRKLIVLDNTGNVKKIIPFP